MLSNLRPAIVMIVLFTALTGFAYPLAITGIAQVAFKGPSQWLVGHPQRRSWSAPLSIGQTFATDRYFQGRPSVTSAPDPKDPSKAIDAPYNAANSSGSNLGPTSQKLIDRVKASVTALGGSASEPVPADAVTTSGSGLDPDISPAFAMLQVIRVANTRKLPADKLQTLVADNTLGASMFSEPTVNVLRLNLALDGMASGAQAPSASNGAPTK